MNAYISNIMFYTTLKLRKWSTYGQQANRKPAS